MKRLVFCIVAALALSFSTQQANAQYAEGRYYLEVNGDMWEGAGWAVYLPTRYSTVDVQIKAYKCVNGSLVSVPWAVDPNFAAELNKVKVNSTTLRVSLNKPSTSNTFCAVGIIADGQTGGSAKFQFGVFWP